MRFLTGAVAAIAALSSIASGEPVPTFEDDPYATRIPLHRRDINFKNPDGSANLILLNQEVDRTVRKYTRNRAILKANGINVGLSARGTEDFDDEDDSLETEVRRSHGEVVERTNLKTRGTTSLYFVEPYCYSAAVQIGTPPQLFNMYLDTGSTDFAVADSLCTNCGTAKTRYSNSSSTFIDTKRRVQSGFADGSSNTGTVTLDNFRVAGSPITNQTFIRASQLSSTLVSFAVDGMGMAYQSIGITGATSIPFTAQAQGNGNYFMLRLSNRQGFSELSLGNIDRARVGGQTYSFPVLQDTTNGGLSRYTYWQLGLSSPNVNGKAVLSPRATHIIDSGSNFVFAPQAGADQFWAAVPGSSKMPGSSSYYLFPCASPPTVSFSFTRVGTAWNNYTMDPDEFNLGTYDAAGTLCVGAVLSANLGLGGRWLLGSSFMKNWLIIHDMGANQLTFATPKDRLATAPGSV